MFMDDQTETLLRLHIADPATAEGGPLLSYDDLFALYRGADGSLPRTVAAALRTIAASEVLVSKKIRTQDLQTDGPAVAAELRALPAGSQIGQMIVDYGKTRDACRGRP